MTTVTRSSSARTATIGASSLSQLARLRTRAEEADDASAAGADIRVVLDVSLGQPFVGFIPVIALQELSHDSQRDLFVGVELRIRIGEQRFGIGDA